jgi:hypothetical protein
MACKLQLPIIHSIRLLIRSPPPSVEINPSNTSPSLAFYEKHQEKHCDKFHRIKVSGKTHKDAIGTVNVDHHY